MNDTKVSIAASPPIHLNVNANRGQTIVLGAPSNAGTRNYNNLSNKPQINGVTLQGNQTPADLGIVSENTESGWAQTPLYVPQRGEICLYSDTGRIKIGDGVVPLIDLPYLGSTDNELIMDALRSHTSNAVIHVSQEDRDRWDAKLNYTTVGEELIFNRL